MNFDEYQEAAAEFCAPGMTRREMLINCALGLAGEAGEVADHVKKHLFQGHELSTVLLIKELGDLLWYMSEMANYLGRPLSDVAGENILKLQKRYPEGYFTEERSRNRGVE